jgi:hypothetical protein
MATYGENVTVGGKKLFFFDRVKVIRAADRAKLAAQSKAGAFIRSDAKKSIRYAKDPKQKSSPGRPPLARTVVRFTREKKNRKTGQTERRPSSPLRELIFFAYDPARKTVVIGPADFKARAAKSWRAPEALEKALTVTDRTPRGVKTLRFRGNPFMVPALEKNLPQFAGAFKNSITNE